jgi:hypothetical protein
MGGIAASASFAYPRAASPMLTILRRSSDSSSCSSGESSADKDMQR